jgi:hypothetical protein
MTSIQTTKWSPFHNCLTLHQIVTFVAPLPGFHLAVFLFKHYSVRVFIKASKPRQQPTVKPPPSAHRTLFKFPCRLRWCGRSEKVRMPRRLSPITQQNGPRPYLMCDGRFMTKTEHNNMLRHLQRPHTAIPIMGYESCGDAESVGWTVVVGSVRRLHKRNLNIHPWLPYI